MLEELSESVFNLQVPLQLLKCYIQEDRKLIEDIRSLGHVSDEWVWSHCNLSLLWVGVVTLQLVLVVGGCGHTATCPCCGWVWSHCNLSLSWVGVVTLQLVLVVGGCGHTATCAHPIIRTSPQLGLDWGSIVESFKAFLLEAISEYQMNIDAMNAVFLEGGCGSGCDSGYGSQ